jgi:hypothetical protein
MRGMSEAPTEVSQRRLAATKARLDDARVYHV